ncbi:MAG: beta-ketoacyl-ACP synthase [Formosimonas sp.]
MNLVRIYIQDLNAMCSLGNNLHEIERHLFDANDTDFGALNQQYSEQALYLSPIHHEASLPIDTPVRFKSRNNGLLYHTFQGMHAQWQAATQNVATHRLGIVIGSSNSGIEESELAMAYHTKHGNLPKDYEYAQQEYGSPALYLANLLDVTGPAYTISTACSSSAKAFISGARLIQADICDVVLVGGSDALSQLTVKGFMSLEAVDGGRSKPFSANRTGIHLGEACALFILSQKPAAVELRGWGESSDAHHMSAPHPEGLGAQASMQQALHKAKLDFSQIDYVNLHGTATLQNDAMEAKAVSRVLPHQPAVSSTKSLTGHTLGAAGAIEAAFCWLALTQETLPTHHWDGVPDPELPPLNFACTPTQIKPRYILSNSFGFGGSNASLIFAKV